MLATSSSDCASASNHELEGACSSKGKPLIFCGDAMRCVRRTLLLASFWLFLYLPSLRAQQFGAIMGEIHVNRGEFPGRVLVELQLRGSPISTVYTDEQGKFGFSPLGNNAYHIIIRDERFYPVDERVILDLSVSATQMVQLHVTRREEAKKDTLAKPTGSNPYMVDLAEYTRQFPKKTVKEFQKGVNADAKGKREEAIAYYEKAISLSPDFYPAHNNLGSAELSRANFAAARREFEQVVKLNQSDAAAHFNLSNVCMLSGQLVDARRFLEEGLRRQPESGFGKFLLGSLELREGNTKEAESALHQAIQLSPTMSQARLQLVNLYLQENRKQEAIAMLRAFINMFPADPFAPRAAQLLQKLDASAQIPTKK
jgi:tetratricopeptide (TPR) repeat protein